MMLKPEALFDLHCAAAVAAGQVVRGASSGVTRREVSLGAHVGWSSEYSFWWLMHALSCRGLLLA